MNWIYSTVTVGNNHFVEFREKRPVAVSEMLIVKCPVLQRWRKMKIDPESVSVAASPSKVNPFFRMVGPVQVKSDDYFCCIVLTDFAHRHIKNNLPSFVGEGNENVTQQVSADYWLTDSLLRPILILWRAILIESVRLSVCHVPVFYLNGLTYHHIFVRKGVTNVSYPWKTILSQIEIYASDTGVRYDSCPVNTPCNFTVVTVCAADARSVAIAKFLVKIWNVV